MKISTKTFFLATAASGLMIVNPGVALAQDAAESGNENIIIVTAKNREQRLQEVPLPITVFDATELENRGISNVQELAAFTPNFNIYSGSGRQDASAINVRGLSANTSDERYQPVSFFVDGIFMGGLTVGLQTIDVQRIEVIKGPQSATFGRATYAGAIDFVTTTPSLSEFGGKFSAEISSNEFDNTSYEVSGSINGPIVEDVLSASLFAQYSRRDGFPQVVGGQFPEVGQEDTFALNGVIFAQLGDNTTLKLRGIYSKEDDQEPIYHTTQPLYWEQQGANIVTLPSGALFIQGNVPDPIRDRIRGVDLTDPTIASPSNGGYTRDRYFGSAILTHNFDSGAELSYRGSYLHNRYDAYVDFRGRTFVGVDPIFGQVTAADQAAGFGFALRFPFPFQEEFEETSHQIRIVSPDDGRFRWSAGAYYYWSADKNFQSRTDRPAPAGNPASQTRGTENIINYAGFGSMEFDITD